MCPSLIRHKSRVFLILCLWKEESNPGSASHPCKKKKVITSLGVTVNYITSGMACVSMMMYKSRRGLRSVRKGRTRTWNLSFVQCGLYESGLTDQLTINFDPTGEVLGVSEHAIPGRCTGAIVDASNLTNWKTAVDAIQSVSGPVWVFRW